MAITTALPPTEPFFVGRERELQEIRRLFYWGYSNEILMINGLPGIGKTALARESLKKQDRNITPLWFSFDNISQRSEEFSKILDQSLTGRTLESLYPEWVVVVLDGADGASTEELYKLTRVIFNYKRVGGIIVTSRQRIRLKGHEIRLESLSQEEKREILNKNLREALSYETAQSLIEKVGDSPLAISLVSNLLQKLPADQVLRNLDGQVYDLKKSEQSRIVQALRPEIVSFSNELIVQLKKSPDKLHDVNSRQFEHLIADLFHDMGWEVELTQATRDGGRDILAHLNTGVTKLLCLIEAKKYRYDRPVGIQLVKNLYGTFCDEQANSAMLVTTSYFTSDAKKFQAKHKYQLALRDYTDVVGWLANYKASNPSRSR
jgi:restriction system protein